MTDKNLQQFQLAEKYVNEEVSENETNNDQDMASNKCNQCDFASSQAGGLRRHLKTHSGEKANKCNQCDYASSQAGHLRTHLKIHGGEKSNKCKQCDFASSNSSNLKRHLKRHNGEK